MPAYRLVRLTIAALTAAAVLAAGGVVDVGPTRPAAAAVEAASAPLAPPTPAKAGTTSRPLRLESDRPYRMAEMTELRGKHFRRYLMSDGSVQAVVSQRAMHYQDHSGDWQEIDTAVEAGTEKVSFRNDTNSFVSEFGSTTGELGAVEYAGHRVAIGRAGAVEPVTPRADGPRVTYADVFGAGDVRYTVLPDALKEDIVLPSVPEQETFEFNLTVGDLRARGLEDGSVGLFAAGEADPVFVLPKPYMVDSSDGATAEDGWSYGVRQSFTHSDGELTVTITPDRARSVDCRYPLWSS